MFDFFVGFIQILSGPLFWRTMSCASQFALAADRNMRDDKLSPQE